MFTNLERLKLELNNKDYYTDEEYIVFLQENNLKATDVYNKEENEINLLFTVIAVLETLANDVDLMRKLDSKDIMSIGEAEKWLLMRIDSIKNKISNLQSLKNNSDDNTCIKPLFFKNR